MGVVARAALGLGVLSGAACLLPCVSACVHDQTFAVHFQRADKTPGNASVIIDEEYIGPLSYVAAHGVRMPAGEHRISIEKDGYFPYDKLVKEEDGTIQLKVELVPVPD